MRRATWEGASAGGVVVSGNHLPNPLPPRVRPHSSIARPAHSGVRRFPEHARDRAPMAMPVALYTDVPATTPAPCGAPVEPPRRGPRGRSGGVAHEERNPPFRGSRPTPGVRPEPTARSAPGAAGRAVFGSPPGPDPGGGRRTPRRGRRPRRGGVRGRAGAPGCAPVERLISAHATVHFQPTSRTGPFLVEMADQPPCHQAGRDRAVRFGPMGTGHERRTHFPARAASETLRDRTLPARLPCRQ